MRTCSSRSVVIISVVLPQLSYDFPKGSTAVLKTNVRDLIVGETVRQLPAGDVPMELA